MQRIRDNRIFQRFIPAGALSRLVAIDKWKSKKGEREREEEDRGG